MIAITIILSIILLGVLCVRADRKSAARDEAAAKKESEEWLEKEKKKILSKVIVTTKSGKIYNTEAFEPESDYEFFMNCVYVKKLTSVEKSVNFIENSIKKGYFTADSFIVPTCEIEHYEIVGVER